MPAREGAPMTNAFIAGDLDLAVAFLDQWEPDGPWLLSAIKPDSRAIETQRFDDPEKMRIWLGRHQGESNIYFSVNRARPGLNGRAKKQDIAYLLALHVDLDPPKEASASDLVAVQAALRAKLEQATPPPSCVIFSGGGYQGFWRLDEPALVNGNAAEAYNVALEQELGGDHCHNIDRVMRLPGTINLPDARKRALGRTAAVAALVYFDPDRLYHLDDFSPARPNGAGIGARTNHDTSRSAEAFRIAARVKTAGGTYDEMVEALKRDPATEAWLREKGDGRQLQRLWDRAGRPHGVTLDDFWAYMPMHAYIYAPTRDLWPARSVNSRLGKVALLDDSGKPLADDDGKPVEIPASSWLDRRKPIEQMTWSPGEPMILRDRLIAEGAPIERPGVSCFNLYVPPPELLGGNARRARRWLDHLRRLYPGDGEAEHLCCWLAHRLQRPAEKPNHAIVLGGAQGIGKDTLLEPVKRGLGAWNCAEVSPRTIVEARFNSFARTILLRVSEVRDLGDVNRYSFYEATKVYTAAPPDMLRCNEKHLREFHIINCCGVVMTTNYKAGGIYLPADDRRHFVAWSTCKKEDFEPEYWNDLWGFYENGGVADIVAYLRGLDLGLFDAKAPPPKTPAFWAIVDANAAPEDGELADLLDKIGNPDAVTLTRLIENSRDAQGFIAGIGEWLNERKNRRLIPHRMEACGYVPVRNPAADSGLWVILGKRQAIYAKATLSLRDQLAAATKLAGSRPMQSMQ
jgi:hypothetical protein